MVRLSSPLARARRTKDVMVGVQPVGCVGGGGCWVCVAAEVVLVLVLVVHWGFVVVVVREEGEGDIVDE